MQLALATAILAFAAVAQASYYGVDPSIKPGEDGGAPVTITTSANGAPSIKPGEGYGPSIKPGDDGKSPATASGGYSHSIYPAEGGKQATTVTTAAASSVPSIKPGEGGGAGGNYGTSVSIYPDEDGKSHGGSSGPSTNNNNGGYYVAPPASTPPASTSSKAAPSDGYTPACGDATPSPTGGKNGPSTTAYAAKNTYSKNDSNIVYSAATGNSVASAGFVAAAVGVAALFL